MEKDGAAHGRRDPGIRPDAGNEAEKQEKTALSEMEKQQHTEAAGADRQHGSGRGRLLRLFLTTLYISAFTFGGGFVIVTFMKRKFVDELGWLDEKEMLDFTALAQSSPGAIAVNAAILVGWKVYGLAGMVVAVLGTILPPMVILSVISFFYAAFSSNLWVALVLKGMQAGVAAVILDVACDLGGHVVKERSVFSSLVLVGAFVCGFFLNVNVVYIILTAAVIGVVRTLWMGRRGRSA